MVYPLPEDIKKRAEKKCRDYPYLKVVDPGTVLHIEGKMLVLVVDEKQRPLWLEA